MANFFKNYTHFTVFLSFFSFIYGVYYAQFYYDGHHYGLVLSDAYNFAENKKPYKDFFTLYGYIPILINSLALKIFNLGLMSLVIITNLLYSLSLIFLYFLSTKFISKLNSFILILIIFVIHPAPSYPWSNYYFFFFIIISLILFINFTYLSISLSSIFLIFATFSREIVLYYILFFFIYILSISFIIYISKNQKIFDFKKILFFFINYLLTLGIIFFILYYDKSLNYFFDYLELPKNFLKMKNENFFGLFAKLWHYLFSFSLNRLINESYIFIFSLIFILNCFYLLILLKNLTQKKLISIKEINLGLISISSLFFFTLSLNEINAFRIICGSSIGLITIFYYIEKIKDKNIYYDLVLILFILSILNLNFLSKNDSNLIFITSEEISSKEKIILDQFKYNKFSKEVNNNLLLANEKFKKIKNSCNIKNALNYQKDIFFKLIAQEYFTFFQNIPWGGDFPSDYLSKIYNKDLYTNVREKLLNDDLIIITTPSYKKKLFENISQNYSFRLKEFSLPFTYLQKQILIFYPSNCVI